MNRDGTNWKRKKRDRTKWYETPEKAIVVVSLIGSILVLIGQIVAVFVPIIIGPMDTSDFKITVGPVFSEIQIWPNHPDFINNISPNLGSLIYLKNSSNISIRNISIEYQKPKLFKINDIYIIIPKNNSIKIENKSDLVIEETKEPKLIEYHNSVYLLLTLNVNIDNVDFIHSILKRYNNNIRIVTTANNSDIDIRIEKPNGYPPFETTVYLTVKPNIMSGDYPILVQGFGGDGKIRSATFYLRIINYERTDIWSKI